LFNRANARILGGLSYNEFVGSAAVFTWTTALKQLFTSGLEGNGVAVTLWTE